MEGYHSDEDEEYLGGQVIYSIQQTDNEDWYISEKLIKQKTNVDSLEFQKLNSFTGKVDIFDGRLE